MQSKTDPSITKRDEAIALLSKFFVDKICIKGTREVGSACVRKDYWVESKRETEGAKTDGIKAKTATSHESISTF